MKSHKVQLFISFISVSALTLLTIAGRAFAYDTSLGNIAPPIDGDLFKFIGDMSSYIRPLVGLGFLAVVIYGGWTRMTATGNAEKEKKSMQILIAGVVGFIIIVLAPVIVKLISGLIGLQNNLF